MLKQHPKTTRLARHLRENETWGERLMWSWLRDKRFSEYKFRRQHPIGPDFLDFFCIEARLNIEVDGSQHGLPENRLADAERDAFLAAQGIKTLRSWNGRLRREKKLSETPSGKFYRNAPRIRCRIIARQSGGLKVKANRCEHSNFLPHPGPLPLWRGRVARHPVIWMQSAQNQPTNCDE